MQMSTFHFRLGTSFHVTDTLSLVALITHYKPILFGYSSSYYIHWKEIVVATKLMIVEFL